MKCNLQLQDVGLSMVVHNGEVSHFETLLSRCVAYCWSCLLFVDVITICFDAMHCTCSCMHRHQNLHAHCDRISL